MGLDINARISAAIAAGMAMAGCSDRSIGDDAHSGDDSGSSSADATTHAASSSSTAASTSSTAATSDPATTDTTDASSTSSTTVTTDDYPKFDLGNPDVGGTPLPTHCEAAPPPPDGCDILPAIVYGCLEVDGVCPDPDDPIVTDSLAVCVGRCEGAGLACGPAEGTTPCCYWAEVGTICPGRPFMVDGLERLAPVITRDDWGDDWLGDLHERTSLPDPIRDALAAAWAEDARFEHASVASFARFVLHLLALGAPAALVADAQRALGDELAHARAFFELASRYAGHAIGPGPLRIAGALDDADDPIAVVVAAVAEGCIAETISAQQIARARDLARDPAVRAHLETIAGEELAHAELAWRFVAWAYARGDADLQRAIADAFASPHRHIPRGVGVACPQGAESTWAAHGRLTDDERRAIAHATIDRIIRPCSAALGLRPGRDPCDLGDMARQRRPGTGHGVDSHRRAR